MEIARRGEYELAAEYAALLAEEVADDGIEAAA
jgi:hypothetical protein